MFEPIPTPPDPAADPAGDSLAGVHRQTVWLLGCERGCEHCPPHAGYRDDVLGARGLSPKTWTHFRTILRQIWTGATPDGDPASLTFPDYRAWQARPLDPRIGNVRGAYYSPNSLRQHDKVIWPCYEWARTMGLIAGNPFEGKKQSRGSAAVARDLPDAEIVALYRYIATLDLRTQAIIALAAHGFRVGEIAAMRRERFRAGRMPSVTVRRMKGTEEWRVPLDPQVASILTALIATYDRERGPLIEDLTEPGKHVKSPWVGRLVREVMRSAGANESAHALRHTFATVLAKRGESESVIAFLLGHKNLTSTQGYIIGAKDDLARAALREAWLPGSTRPPDDRPDGRPEGRPGPLRRAPALQRPPAACGAPAGPGDQLAPRSPAHPNQPAYPPVPGPSVPIPVSDIAHGPPSRAESEATASPAQAIRRARRRPRDRGLSMRRRRGTGDAR